MERGEAVLAVDDEEFPWRLQVPGGLGRVGRQGLVGEQQHGDGGRLVSPPFVEVLIARTSTSHLALKGSVGFLDRR